MEKDNLYRTCNEQKVYTIMGIICPSWNTLWFLWIRRLISLKFQKWFIKWLSEFGSLLTKFPFQVIEIYSYFRKNISFDS